MRIWKWVRALRGPIQTTPRTSQGQLSPTPRPHGRRVPSLTLYLAQLVDRQTRAATLAWRLVVISLAHKAADLPSPTTSSLVSRTLGTAQNGKPPAPDGLSDLARTEMRSEEAPESFGDLLRAYRTAANLQQEELAERAGLSARGISDLERGARTRPYTATIHRLARALGLDEQQAAGLFHARSARQIGARRTAGAQHDSSLLSLSLTRFIGRERDLLEVQRLLGTTRLLTLTGTGGIGKTRLALRLASEASTGVCVVELASVSDRMALEHAILNALGGRESPRQTVLEVITSKLAPAEMLLVLDNCEHLLDACAEVSQVILARCPRVRFLVTSREVLQVPGEFVWRVAPLSVPSEREHLTLAELGEFESLQLFVDRARHVAADFTLGEDNAAVVADICRRLDGIPLAIELAAARLSLLSVREIAQRLDTRFDLLTRSGRGVPPRHQTLRATLDWSYDLLESREKLLLRRLSVFAGGCTLEAAESVCAGGRIATGDALNLLGRLVDRSLVVAEKRGGAARVRLLETVRAYAAEQLVGEELADVRRRHRDWYLSLAEASDPGLVDPRQVSHLEFDYDNLRAALRWSLDTAEFEPGLRLANALWLFWYVRGLYAEGRAWLEELLAASVVEPASAARGAALYWTAHLANCQGQHSQALSLLSESISVCRLAGYARGVEVCAVIAGNAKRDNGDPDGARHEYEKALRLARESGDWIWEIVALCSFGHALCDQGDYDYAAHVADQALKLANAQNHLWATGRANYILGRVETARKQLGRAEERFDEALRAHRELGYSQGVVWVHLALARLRIEQQDRPAARDVLGECLVLAQETGDQVSIGQTLDLFAELLAVDAPEVAVQAAAAAEALRDAMQSRPPQVGQSELTAALDLARNQLDTVRWAAAWESGRRLPLGKACDLVRTSASYGNWEDE